MYVGLFATKLLQLSIFYIVYHVDRGTYNFYGNLYCNFSSTL